MSPFAVNGPAVVSFSGGRTSALMLRRMLDEGLRPDVHVLFANTGKEREETLQFVHDCATRWGAAVTWLEWDAASKFRVVSFETASRDGRPFAELIAKRRTPPNPVARYCTQELKIRVMRDWMLAQGYQAWTMVVGLRADEPRRVSRMRASEGKERWDVAMPLSDAGITNRDVVAFWGAQAFDLRLQPWEGNCDLCFLKGTSKKERIIDDRPELAGWWIAQEARTGQPFRRDVPSYADMAASVRNQMRLFRDDSGDGVIDCMCSEGTEAEAA